MESTPSCNQASIAKLYKGLHLVTRSIHRRCSIKNVLLIISCNFINKETLMAQVSFPVNFAKFLRTPFLQNTSGRLLLGNAHSYSNLVIREISKPTTPALTQCSDANTEGELEFRLLRVVEEIMWKPFRKGVMSSLVMTWCLSSVSTQPAFTCSKLLAETLEQDVKYVQS